MKETVEQVKGDAAALETLYREAAGSGEKGAFKDAVAELARRCPEDVLLSAWAYRLDIRPAEISVGISEAAASEKTGEGVEFFEGRRWFVAIGVAIVLGLLYVVMSIAGSSAPFFDPENPIFRLGWAPLTALAILAYGRFLDRQEAHSRWYLGAGLAVAVATGFAAWTGLDTDPRGILVTIHFPFAVWAIVAAAVVGARADVWEQFFAYLAKSVETVVTVGLYVIAGGIFAGLTAGLFGVLGINMPDWLMGRIAAWGFGAIALLAVATTYDPTRAPVDQDADGGLSRVLQILSRLLMPLALFVLVIYVFVFIPTNFFQAFKERETLIVFNASIMAIAVLLVCAVPPRRTGISAQAPAGKFDKVMRYGVLAVAAITVLLNAYALAAVVGRTLSGGLTPNRHAVLGWNVVTLVMLTTVVVQTWRGGAQRWAQAFRGWQAKVFVLAVAWAAWVLVALPHL